MGYAILAVLFLGLLVLLWGPSIYFYIKYLRKFKSIKFIALVLVVELISSVSLVVFAEFVGLLNPGGYIMASFVFVSFSGFVYLYLCKLRK